MKGLQNGLAWCVLKLSQRIDALTGGVGGIQAHIEAQTISEAAVDAKLTSLEESLQSLSIGLQNLKNRLDALDGMGGV